MKVCFKIAECSLFGAKINKKHETHKRFRTFYLFLSIHCVEFLHLVMEHRSIEKTTSLCQRRHLFPFMLLQIQIKLIKYLTKIIIKHIIIYTTRYLWLFARTRDEEILRREIIPFLAWSFWRPCSNMNLRISFFCKIPQQEHIAII